MKKVVIILILIAISAILAVVEANTIGLPSTKDTWVVISTTIALSIVVFVMICHLSLRHKAKKVFMAFFNGIVIVCFATFAGQIAKFLPLVIDSIPESDNALLIVAVMLGMLYLPFVYGLSLYLYLHHLSGFNLKKIANGD